jgi:hypothetical protein
MFLFVVFDILASIICAHDSVVLVSRPVSFFTIGMVWAVKVKKVYL